MNRTTKLLFVPVFAFLLNALWDVNTEMEYHEEKADSK